jgi:restriction system protein
LGGLVIILGLISPQVRQAIVALGFIALCVLGLAVAGGIMFVIYRVATRHQRQNDGDRIESDFGSDVKGDTGEQRQRESAAPLTTADLLKRLRAIDWFQFEKVVALAYEKQGFSVTRRGGANPDGGIDLVIEKDGQRAAVQCKQWKTWNVGVKAVREFLGALTDSGIQKGIFITLCGYTGDAKNLAEKHGIEIVNEIGLAQLLESTDAKSDPEVLENLCDTRKYCPKCESEMVLRTTSKGFHQGRQFWGCSSYPRCRFTMPLE